MKKTSILLVCLLSIFGCNKHNQDTPTQVSSTSLHINKGNNVEQIVLTDVAASHFINWLKTKQETKKTKNIKMLTTPFWCFVFNEGIKNNLMVYCYYPQLNGIALQRDYLIKNVDFYPLSETDKDFFKTYFNDLSNLKF